MSDMNATSATKYVRAGVWALAVLLAGAASAATCPADVPKGLQATPVADRVVIHGVAMSVAQVHGKEKASDVLERTAVAWKQGGFNVKRNSAVGWDIVSAKGKGCLVTLQLTERKGSFGYLARSDDSKPAMPTALQRGVKLPPDARIDSSVASQDDGRESLVMNMTSRQSLDQLAGFFTRELNAAKWQATRVHKAVDGKTGAESMFVTAQKDRNRVDIVIWPELGSRIVMTISEAI